MKTETQLIEEKQFIQNQLKGTVKDLQKLIKKDIENIYEIDTYAKHVCFLISKISNINGVIEYEGDI